MSLLQKNIEEQVVVVTGATSSVGSAFALLAAKRGAKLVLSSENENDLRGLVCQIRQQGGNAIYVVSDVADIDEVDGISKLAMMEFGRINTWLNCASVSLEAKLTETSMSEKRRIFDLNFWGVVYGCRAALKQMKKSGGAIINIGIVSPERFIPNQGIYAASKHAVKAYTDALRIEFESDQIPISVSLVNSLGYEAEVVAEAILECCHSPKRDVFVGGSAKLYSVMETFVPRLTDYLMERIMTDHSDQQIENDSSFNPRKSAVVAAGLGVAAYAAYKVIQNVRKPGEITH